MRHQLSTKPGLLGAAIASAVLLTNGIVADGTAGWYPFEATGDPTPGEIGLADWIERPAGLHGRIRRKSDRLVYNDRPIKLWGLNLCYRNCAPRKELAEKRAAFYPKYGINSVRLHKYADGPGWAGIQSATSCVEFDQEALDRMDYQVAKLKEAGIFLELSAHFGTIKLGPADRERVPYIEEFGEFEGKKNRVAAPHSAFFYSPELQEIHIQQTLNLLRHRNPHTGLTYAEDPAIFCIEIVNEQSALFFTSMNPLKESPTLRMRVADRFSGWLEKRYGGEEGLRAAWGERALDSFAGEGLVQHEESLERRNILPLGNPWYWDPDQLTGSQAFRRQRLLDSLEFLYTLQVEAYERFERAVRESGYEGEILGSNWQAGRAFSHYANLHSDWTVGIIDRHNYFGGGRGADKKPFDNRSMLARAGSGMLSSGLQQAIDRPFMLSEWIHVFPNEWGVEGPAVIGAYGMGLQGWDVSYMFQNGDAGTFSERIGRDAWDVTAPQVLGVFPAVARHVLRGDVKESAMLAIRKVHVPSLFRGELGFEDRVKQGYDDKELGGSEIPARVLGVARCVVEFTPEPEETEPFELGLFERDGLLLASTGQLAWRESSEKTGGYFMISTAATKAVVGFARGRDCALGEIAVRPDCRFAAIYVTARDQGETIASARKLLVVAMARARNTGMKLDESEDLLESRGDSPVLLEPVRARVTVRRPGVVRVRLLDHDGLPTESTIAVEDGVFTIDGTRDRTPYYLIEFEGE